MKKVVALLIVTLGILSGTVFAVNFSDLTSEHWAYEPIVEMANKGILSGYPDGTFLPNKSITRAEFAKILVLSLNLKDEENKNNIFDDVDSTHWSYNYVRIASNYLSGYTNGSQIYFMPDEEAVREDMAVAIVMATNLQNKEYNLSSLDRFSDKDSISESFKKYVAIAVENNLMRGNANGTFNPKGKLTRAEVSQLMLNTTKELEKITINETEKEDNKVEKELILSGNTGKFVDMRNNGFVMVGSHSGYVDLTHKDSIVKSIKELFDIYDEKVEYSVYSDNTIVITKIIKDGNEDDIKKYEETDLTISVDKVKSPFEKTDSIKISFNRDLKSNEIYEVGLYKKGSSDGMDFIDYAKKSGKEIIINGQDIFSAIEKNAFIGISKVDGASVTITIRVLYYNDEGYSRLLFEKPINLTLKNEEKKLLKQGSGQFVDMRGNRYVMIATDSTSYSGYVDFTNADSVVKNMDELFDIYDKIVKFAVYSDNSIVITDFTEKDIDLVVRVNEKIIKEDSENTVYMSINETPIVISTSSQVKKILYKWNIENQKTSRFSTQDGDNSLTNKCEIVPELDLDYSNYTFEAYYIDKNGNESKHYNYKFKVYIENTIYSSVYQNVYLNNLHTKGKNLKIDASTLDVSGLEEGKDLIALQITGLSNVYMNKLTKIKFEEVQKLEHISEIENNTLYMEKQNGDSGINLSIKTIKYNVAEENIFIYRCKLWADGKITVKGIDTVKAQDIGSDTFKVDDKIMQIKVNDKNSLLIFREN